MKTGDARRSIEERYPTRDAYLAAVRKAADALVGRRHLLVEDAQRLVGEAERNGVRHAP